MSGDYFVMGLIAMNTGAAIFYAWEGAYTKAGYWCCVIGLNYFLLRMR